MTIMSTTIPEEPVYLRYQDQINAKRQVEATNKQKGGKGGKAKGRGRGRGRGKTRVQKHKEGKGSSGQAVSQDAKGQEDGQDATGEEDGQDATGEEVGQDANGQEAGQDANGQQVGKGAKKEHFARRYTPTSLEGYQFWVSCKMAFNMVLLPALRFPCKHQAT